MCCESQEEGIIVESLELGSKFCSQIENKDNELPEVSSAFLLDAVAFTKISETTGA